MPSDKEMLEDIQSSVGCVNGIELSQWEQEFIESIEEQLDEGRTLTEKQHDKLAEIWDRV